MRKLSGGMPTTGNLCFKMKRRILKMIFVKNAAFVQPNVLLKPSPFLSQCKANKEQFFRVTGFNIPFRIRVFFLRKSPNPSVVLFKLKNK